MSDMSVRVLSGGGSEHWVDNETGALIINESAAPTDQIMGAMMQQHPEVATLIRWQLNNAQTPGSRRGGMFERDRYVNPANIYQQMRLAYDAVDRDDVVSGVLDTTEALAFAKIDIECEDPDQENVWNQIREELDLDSRMREMWRELYTVSQFYCVNWWGRKTFKVSGTSDKGISRKKSYSLKVPLSLAILDPLKVMPVGDFMFNQERLAYIARPFESAQFLSVLAGENTSDLVVSRLIEAQYIPDEIERILVGDLGVPFTDLFLLRNNSVWRHTLTRAQYERFARLRIRSVFELLDLKSQLRQMDRAYLIGGTNFIVLVRKGSDQFPAKPPELAQLAGQMRTAARVPVIVGDHRTEIEIITPDTDLTLSPERYDTIDSRIEARLYQMLTVNGGTRNDDSIKLARVVARSLESRRHMLKKAVEKNVLKPIMEANSSLTAKPKLVFHPKHVALDFDPAWATVLQDIRDRGDLSRESMLDELDFSEADEARKRQMEKKYYDDIFETVVPFSGQDDTGTGTGTGSNKTGTKADPRTAGRNRGGNRNGGGSNPDSKTPNSSPSRPKKTPGTPVKRPGRQATKAQEEVGEDEE